jgi:hypothetical protein
MCLKHWYGEMKVDRFLEVLGTLERSSIVQANPVNREINSLGTEVERVTFQASFNSPNREDSLLEV